MGPGPPKAQGCLLAPLTHTCLWPWAAVPAGSGDFLDSWRKRVTRPRPGQLPFRSPREWAGAGPEGRGTFWKVGTGRRFSAERARSSLGEGQRARRKRQASEQSPAERRKKSEQGGMCAGHPGGHTLQPPATRLTCVCRGDGGSFFLKHFGIKVPEVSWGEGKKRTGVNTPLLPRTPHHPVSAQAQGHSPGPALHHRSRGNHFCPLDGVTQEAGIARAALHCCAPPPSSV